MKTNINFLLLFIVILGFSAYSFNEKANKEGINREYYSNGTIKEMWSVKKGKKEGFYNKYFPSGEIQFEMNYSKDQLEGIQKKYFEHGKVEKEWRAKKGLKQGKERVYFFDGDLYKILNYKNNVLEGSQKIYRSTGALHKIKKYKNGKLHGMQKGFWLNGNVSTEYYYENGSLNGEYKTFSPSGELIQKSTYKNGKLTSSTVDSNFRVNFDELDYKYSGAVAHQTYYDTTELRARANTNKSLLDGLLQRYYLNGAVKSITHYIEGLKDGIQIIYYDTGEIQSRLYYVEDKLEGIQEYFYRNGVLRSREIYSDGYKHGLQEYYFNNGVLYARKVFQQGNLIRLQRFIYENGVFKTVEEFIDGQVQKIQAGEEMKLNVFSQVEEIQDLTIPVRKVEKYANGNIKIEFEVDEYQNVFQRTYFENAQLQFDVQWDGTKFISFAEYDQDGELVQQELVSIFKRTDLIQDLQFCQMLRGQYENNQCILLTDDTLRECFDSLQCQGKCIAYDAQPGSTVQGACSSKTDGIEGCYNLIKGGKALAPNEGCEE